MAILKKTTWRLIRSQPPESGARNMAIDEAILQAVGLGKVPPTMRLYGWQPPCLSLGYAQPASDVDFTMLAANGWGLVRRPTGGRAILHTDELTYAVIAPIDEPRLAGGVLESYQTLAHALLRALNQLEIPAELVLKPPPEADDENHQESSKSLNPVCFDMPSNYEITVRGKKLIGSAQARRKEGVLQHGSLPLYGDLARITRGLKYPDDPARDKAAQYLMEHATTAESILGMRLQWDDAANAFTQAFCDELNLDLHEESLTEFEMQRADQLVQQKYSHDQWTMRI